MDCYIMDTFLDIMLIIYRHQIGPNVKVYGNSSGEPDRFSDHCIIQYAEAALAALSEIFLTLCTCAASCGKFQYGRLWKLKPTCFSNLLPLSSVLPQLVFCCKSRLSSRLSCTVQYIRFKSVY
jgi:hypothetical protein